MTAGFQLFNTSGTFQIDGNFPQFVMRRKVIMSPATEQYGDGGVDDGYWWGWLDLADDEIVAIRPSDWAAVGNKYLGKTMIIAQNYNTTVECFIFAKVTDVGSRQGFQVFSPAGVLVFDAMQRIMAMTAFPVGDGTFLYTAGRKYAAVVMNQSLDIQEYLYNAGGFDYMRRTSYRGMLKAADPGITVLHRKYWKLTEDISGGYNVNAVTTTVPNRIIVLDVTNY